MGYSPKMMQTQNMTLSKNHWKITIDVFAIGGEFIERIVRTVMCEGDQYITYKEKRYPVKKLKKRGDIYSLKIIPWSKGQ